MMVSEATRASKARYDQANPKLTVRVTSEEKEALADRARRAGKSVASWIHDRIVSPEPSPERPPGAGVVDQASIKNDFAYLFSFFQRNRDALDMDDEVRTSLKGILQRVKNL